MDAYERNELKMFHDDMARWERQDAKSAREGEAEATDCLDKYDPRFWGERMKWLAQGDYGDGARLHAECLIEPEQRVKLLIQIEFCLPAFYARRVWNSLPVNKQKAILEACNA